MCKGLQFVPSCSSSSLQQPVMPGGTHSCSVGSLCEPAPTFPPLDLKPLSCVCVCVMVCCVQVRPEFVNDFKAKLWSRFFCLSVYITMYLNDHQRSAFYESLGLNTTQVND